MTWRKTISAHYKKLNQRSNEIKNALLLDDIFKNKEFYDICEEMDGIEHVIGCTGDFYDYVVKYCKENNIHSALDIGCAYGHQAEAFLEAGIGYEGVNDWNGPLWKKDQITYHIGKFPFDIETSAELAISNLCYGYFIHDYEILAKKYSHVILNNINDMTEIEKYFDVEKVFAYDSETQDNSLTLYVLTRNLEKCKNAGLEIDLVHEKHDYSEER